MAALKPGTLAPDFALGTTDRKRFSLAEARAKGPVVLAFFKVSCPVCQFSLPYLQRLHQSYGAARLTVVGVSQNPARETLSFMREYGINFPVLLDDPSNYDVSNQFGITTVPTTFLIGRDGKVRISSVGWDRVEIDDVSASLAQTTGIKARVFHPGEDVPAHKAG